ncbi:MAG: N-acetylmuramoyl-L-alanine amidase family protein [Spirochaetota bacterium]
MDLSALRSIFLCALLLLIGISCTDITPPPVYNGKVDLSEYPWLKNRRIFIDPGHGGQAGKDRFRHGPGGITEEGVNLTVARILGVMLQGAGCVVELSRNADIDVSLDRRTHMARQFKPDLFISIHHNGSPRRVDQVQYPAVLFWGSERTRPLSFQMARLLRDEFTKIMEGEGVVLSDFAVFPEAGTRVLKNTKYLCPGILGEGGFFSHEKHARHLADREYLEAEAEAYFSAIAEFFRRGIPSAEVLISSPFDEDHPLENAIHQRKPQLTLRLLSGHDSAVIKKGSLRVTLNRLPVTCKKESPTDFNVHYSGKLPAGYHTLRFSFENTLGQPSMVFRSTFFIIPEKGEYQSMIQKGQSLINSRGGQKEGLHMLLAALSLGTTDPSAPEITWHIARGFAMLGMRDEADYYYGRLYHFFPESKYRRKVPGRLRTSRFPVDYRGRPVPISHEDKTPPSGTTKI